MNQTGRGRRQLRAVPAGARAGLGARRCESFQSLGARRQRGRRAAGNAADLASPDKLQAAAAAVRSTKPPSSGSQGFAAQAAGDKRFAGEAWGSNPVASFSAAVYLLNARTLLGLAEAVEADAKTTRAPALRGRAVDGRLGAQQLPRLQRRGAEEGHRDPGREHRPRHAEPAATTCSRATCRMTDESAFEVGRNVATTEGAVVFENELFQLLEYKPLTAKVYERPLPAGAALHQQVLHPRPAARELADPLCGGAGPPRLRRELAQPGRSRWPRQDLGRLHRGRRDQGDRRRAGDHAAAKQINALGFCVGGTILGTALAVLAARGEKPVASVTLLTTLLDFTDTGVLDIFIDEPSCSSARCRWARAACCRAANWPPPSASCGPNDLVWNYVVGNYLKGETPPPFDLLYWNSDATNLPGPMYAWYLRNTYLENKLRQARRADRVRREDRPAARSTRRSTSTARARTTSCRSAAPTPRRSMLPGKKRFVMGASGHIAGVINPPAKKKRSHWIRDDGKLPKTQDEWLAGANEHPGSWWTDWSAWLKTHAGKQIPAPKSLRQGQRLQGDRARARPLRQGEGLSPSRPSFQSHASESTPWKTSSSFRPHAPPSASSAARWPASRPPSWAPS